MVRTGAKSIAVDSRPMVGLLLVCLGSVPVTVSAAGDLHLGSSSTEAQLASLSQLLTGDVRFVNLEGPLTASGHESGVEVKPGSPPAPLRFNAPPGMAPWLHGRVDAVSLANNHALDQGPAGLRETVAPPHAEGLQAATATEDAVLERQGRHVRLIARELPEHWTASVAAALEARVREARATGPVLVSLHWGRTGALLPSREQRALAGRLIDAGASAVLGHGPHTPQGLERHGRGVIAYSLGNLIFDGGRGAADWWSRGELLEVSLGGRGPIPRALTIPVAAPTDRPQTPFDKAGGRVP